MPKNAAIAYQDSPLSSADLKLLVENIDLAIVTNAASVAAANAAGTQAKLLDYRIVTMLPPYNVIDWLAYADQNKLDRELGFFHVTQPWPFKPPLTGFSCDGFPVAWWWDAQAFRSGVRSNLFAHFNHFDCLYPNPSFFTDGKSLTKLGEAVGDFICWGYSDPFDRIDFVFSSLAGNGWAGIFEYPTAVDVDGLPTAWKTLPIVAGNLNADGQVRWQPPRDWVPCLMAKGGTGSFVTQAYPLAPAPYPIGGYYVRLRTTTTGATPIVKSARAHDYTGQGDGFSPLTIPGFDASADLDGDGYLSDAEFAKARPYFLARFRWQSRLGTYGGANVLWANYTNRAMRAWLSDYLRRSIAMNPNFDGYFLDNAGVANLPNVIETGDYPSGFRAALQQANLAMPPSLKGPRVLAFNVGPLAKIPSLDGLGIQWRENMLRTDMTWVDFEAAIAAKSAISPNVIDAYCASGAPSARDAIAMLAAFYCMAGDGDYFGGFTNNTTTGPWVGVKWFKAMGINIVGRPVAPLRIVSCGPDPADPTKTYRYYIRKFACDTVVYRPLSSDGVKPGTNADATAALCEIGRTVDANLATIEIMGVTLRGGEGAIIRA